jgi:hypothetical protein
MLKSGMYKDTSIFAVTKEKERAKSITEVKYFMNNDLVMKMNV